MKPNIFNIATKELSQDAFIIWLLMFADDKYKHIDNKLNECGKKFVCKLIQKQKNNFGENIKSIKVKKQNKNIDIWTEVNDKYLIIIEYKINSKQHSNQLEKYREEAEKWSKENNKEPPILIYLKTGNESLKSLKEVKKKGYSIFTRADFIQLLEKYKDIQNDIFLDFYKRMLYLEEKTNNFINKNIKDWESYDWQGFYLTLEKELDFGDWYYVDNKSGGFLCFLMNWDNWIYEDTKYHVYIQLEEKKLCFKISTNPKEVKLPEGEKRENIRNQFHNSIMKFASEKKLDKIKKPKRFSSGTWMTSAIVEQEDWLGNNDNKVNIKNVVKTLKIYLDFLREIIK